MMTKDEIVDLLNYIGVTKIERWKGDKIRFNCPIHGESNPSCGIHADYTDEHLQIFNCFSCGASGSLARLLFKSMPDEFKTIYQAINFLNERYGLKDTRVTFKEGELRLNLKSYDDFSLPEEVRHELPLYKLAPYKSGKETYGYFYDRGFTKETVKKFMVGRDLEIETVTVPIFWQDSTLAGIIGRYIDPNIPSNNRFKIYDFPKGDVIFPLNHFHSCDGTVILVEGMFDAMYLHQLGYFNTITTFTNSVSKKQAKLLANLNCHAVIDLLDNDRRGREGAKKVKRVLEEFMIWKEVDFPDHGKDPMDWSPNIIKQVIESSKMFNLRVL